MSWHQVPRPAPVRPRPLAAPILLSAVPLGILIHRLGRPDRWIAALALVTVITVVAARARPRWAPVAVGCGTVALALGFDQAGGPKFAALWLICVTLWSVGLGTVSTDEDRFHGGAVIHLALVPLAAANLTMLIGASLAVPGGLALLALVVAVASAARPKQALRLVSHLPEHRAHELIDRAGRWLGAGVSALAMVPVALLTTLVWLVHRIVRHDPLAAPTAVPGGWVERDGPDRTPDRYFGQVAVADDRTVGARRAKAAVTVVFLVVAALAAVAVGGTIRSERLDQAERTGSARASGHDDDGVQPQVTNGVGSVAPGSCPTPAPNPAMDAQPDWPTLSCETEAFGNRAEFYGPATYRLSDFKGTTVNERDGVRPTWAPTACGCTPVRVWLFGGSAAWGFLQRDQHSLASALAREAWSHGVALEITNYAMPGYTLGQEVRTFATVSTLEPAPDLVLFYDGFNDLALQGLRADKGQIDDESEISVMETWVDDLFRDGISLGRPSSVTWSARPEPTGATRQDVADAPAVARHAMARYRRNAELATRIAESIGAKVSFAFQPVLARSPAATGSPKAASPLQIEALGQAVDAARPLLPAGTIDLTDVYRDVRTPIFRDVVHTNERGAQIVAVRLFEALRPQLRASR